MSPYSIVDSFCHSSLYSFLQGNLFLLQDLSSSFAIHDFLSSEHLLLRISSYKGDLWSILVANRGSFCPYPGSYRRCGRALPMLAGRECRDMGIDMVGSND